MRKIDQNGFSQIIAFLAIFLIVIIATGYFVYSKTQKQAKPSELTVQEDGGMNTFSNSAVSFQYPSHLSQEIGKETSKKTNKLSNSLGLEAPEDDLASYTDLRFTNQNKEFLRVRYKKLSADEIASLQTKLEATKELNFSDGSVSKQKINGLLVVKSMNNGPFEQSMTAEFVKQDYYFMLTYVTDQTDADRVVDKIIATVEIH